MTTLCEVFFRAAEDGKIEDADKLLASIKTEWSDFITTESVKGRCQMYMR